MYRLVWLFLSLAAGASGCAGSAENEAPLGLWLWSAETDSPFIELSIQRRDVDWLVTVNHVSVPVTSDEEVLAFTLANGWRFEGQRRGDSSSIRGHWYQSADTYGYSDMVTPIDVPQVSDGVWEAAIALQARPFRVFLDIFVDESGQTTAVIRNPERNEIMRSTRYQVESLGPGWELVSGQGERQRRHALVREGGALRLTHSWFEEPLTLQRSVTPDVLGYRPRKSRSTPYLYEPPVQQDDGWPVVSAEDAGFSRQALDALVAELSNSDPRDSRPRLIHSLLVAHKGKLVVEEYFHGHSYQTTHDTRSLAKVFAPVLIGALQQQGVSIDADHRPIPSVLEAAGETLLDARKKSITLAHLMSFTSGLDCDVNSDSPGSEDNMWTQQEEANFWLYTSRLKLLHEPGKRYAYCSGSINLVGSSLRRAGGKPIVELFDELIAKPLDFGDYQWNLMPNGAAYLGGGTYMRPRDVLKIGAVYANGGRWLGQQIVPADWVTESTTPVIDITPETTGMSTEVFQNAYFGGAAAYEWTVSDIPVGDRTYPYYSATGNGGQILMVVPELELTVLFTGGNYRQGGVWGRWPRDIVGGHIIPALARKEH